MERQSSLQPSREDTLSGRLGASVSWSQSQEFKVESKQDEEVPCSPQGKPHLIINVVHLMNYALEFSIFNLPLCLHSNKAIFQSVSSS